MFIKMKESKGFTLVELMIVVAIIGILAAVAVPFYQRYIQKSRLTAMVWPGVHAIQTNVGTYYSFQNQFATGGTFYTQTEDADTDCFTVTVSDATSGILHVSIDADGATRCDKLRALDGEGITMSPLIANSKIKTWQLSGELAERLGLGGEGT